MLDMTRSLLSSIVSTDHATHNLIANKKREIRNDEKFTTYHQEKTDNDYSARTCVQPCGEDQHKRYQTSENNLNENLLSRDMSISSEKNEIKEEVKGEVIPTIGFCEECSLRGDLLEDLQSAIGHLKVVFESNMCLGESFLLLRCLVYCLILS